MHLKKNISKQLIKLTWVNYVRLYVNFKWLKTWRNVHWMYIECTLNVTPHTALSVQAWQQCSGNAHLVDPSRGGRQATGHRPCFGLRCVDVPWFRRISKRRGWDFLVVKWLWNVVNLLCQSSIRQRCGPQIRIAQNTSKTEIRKDRSTAKSCYVMLCLCGPLHITCTLWDACHTCVACSVWLTKFWTGQGQDIQVVEDLEEPGSLKASCNDHAMWRSRSKKLWPSLTNGKWNWVVPVVNANNVSIDVSRIQ